MPLIREGNENAAWNLVYVSIFPHGGISLPAYYHARFDEFLRTDDDTVFAALNRRAAEENLGPQYQEQVQVWDAQLPVLRSAITHLVGVIREGRCWSVLLEFPIPRMRRRIDCVMLGAGMVFVLEFKSHGEATAADRRQVEEYCLDLRDFHEGSARLQIVPILVLGDGKGGLQLSVDASKAEAIPICISKEQLAQAISTLHESRGQGDVIDGTSWDSAPYKPVPTIIEAAEMMFSGHGVRDIGHAHASADNLTNTSEHLVQTVLRARAEKQHVVCFVTGVPGAGKTLTGLNVVHDTRLGGLGATKAEGATYLSGNGPLVRVLREALARDQSHRKQLTLTDARRNASRAIQNVHQFIWDNYERHDAPWEHAIIFDEAQRAWDADQVRRKRRVQRSEPELIMQIMDRHDDWAVIIGLVGGGQEIHDGEAGLAEWGRAIADAGRRWQVEVCPRMVTGTLTGGGSSLFPDKPPASVALRTANELHLPVPMRTFRADTVASWVNCVLSERPNEAAREMMRLGDYPISLSRSLDEARDWLRARTAGQRRCGLVASSGARRLRVWGVDMQVRPEVVHWFLGPPDDVRSSHYLELAASEFEIQGLELDHIGLCWGGDLTWDAKKNDWRHRRFRGTEWQQVRSIRDRQYLLNKYRVLMTRARESLVIWVPPGSSSDPTINDLYFDEVAHYLCACGISEL